MTERWDPDMLDVTPRSVIVCPVCGGDHYSFAAHSDFEVRHVTLARVARSIPRWYLLASFVTGLLLGAAVARLMDWGLSR